jgi:hypothetical protein
VLRRQRLESLEGDSLDADRLPFFDVDADAHGGLRVVEFRVERRHTRVGEPAVLIERDDTLEIRFELLAAEIAFRSPGQLRACRRREH